MPRPKIHLPIYPRGKKETLHGVFYVAGKHVWRSLGTSDRREAPGLYLKKQAELKSKVRGNVRSIPWPEFLEKHREHCRVEKKESTWNRDEFTIDLFTRECGMRETFDFTPGTLTTFKGMRKGVVSNLTINRNLGILRSMAKFGQESGFIPKELDFKAVGDLDFTKKRRKFFEMEEISKIKAALPAQMLKHRLVIAGGLFTGMRTDELRHLKPKHVNFERNVIEVTSLETWDPKDREERELPLFLPFKEILVEWIEFRRLGPEDYIFVHEPGQRVRGRRMKVAYFNETFKAFLKKIKLSARCYYTLRHTFGTHAADNYPLHLVQNMMGHSNITTTRNYLHIRKKAMEEAAAKPPF